MAIVYQHIRKDTNEVFYIGIGKTIKRAYSKVRTQYWHRIVNKHSYLVEVIKEDLTWEEACEIEKTLIKKHGRKDLDEGNLINMTDGGEGTPNVSPETIFKRGLKTIGKKRSEQYKQEQSIRLSGKNNPNYGKFGVNHHSFGFKQSVKSKENIKMNHKKPMSRKVSQFDKKNNKLNEYPSLTEASKVTGISVGCISYCCSGKTKTSGGYIWKYN
jgi:hypothetical protein